MLELFQQGSVRRRPLCRWSREIFNRHRILNWGKVWCAVASSGSDTLGSAHQRDGDKMDDRLEKRTQRRRTASASGSGRRVGRTANCSCNNIALAYACRAPRHRVVGRWPVRARARFVALRRVHHGVTVALRPASFGAVAQHVALFIVLIFLFRSHVS